MHRVPRGDGGPRRLADGVDLSKLSLDDRKANLVGHSDALQEALMVTGAAVDEDPGDPLAGR